MRGALSSLLHACTKAHAVAPRPAVPSTGLVTKVVDASETVDTAVKMAERIASFSQPIIAMAKETVNAAYEMSLAEGVRFERRIFHSTFSTVRRARVAVVVAVVVVVWGDAAHSLRACATERPKGRHGRVYGEAQAAVHGQLSNDGGSMCRHESVGAPFAAKHNTAAFHTSHYSPHPCAACPSTRHPHAVTCTARLQWLAALLQLGRALEGVARRTG